jgi:hypothetical protein
MMDMNDNLNDILVVYLKYYHLNDRFELFLVSSSFNLNLI